MTEKEIKQLKGKLHRAIGYSSLGFFDFENDPAKWNDFVDTYFSREGIVNDLPYSSELNRRISAVAMYQTLDEVRKRVEKILDDSIEKS